MRAARRKDAAILSAAKPMGKPYEGGAERHRGKSKIAAHLNRHGPDQVPKLKNARRGQCKHQPLKREHQPDGKEWQPDQTDGHLGAGDFR